MLPDFDVEFSSVSPPRPMSSVHRAADFRNALAHRIFVDRAAAYPMSKTDHPSGAAGVAALDAKWKKCTSSNQLESA